MHSLSSGIRTGLIGILVLFTWGVAIPLAFADTITLTPSKDNTLFGDPIGSTSSGAGDGIFSGRVGQNGGGWFQRALVEFDLSKIPKGSIITSASLTLRLVKTNSGNQTHTLHRLLADWGEAGSNGGGGQGTQALPGDATWFNTFYPDQFWSAENGGGDFTPTASASKVIGSSLISYTWASTPQMVADIQTWLDQPETNHGWLVKGNENVLKTAKKFASREYSIATQRPKLIIVYTPPPPVDCPADVVPPTGNRAVDIDDLFGVIGAWGTADAQFDIAPLGDPNGDVDIDDLFLVIGAWGPCQ